MFSNFKIKNKERKRRKEKEKKKRKKKLKREQGELKQTNHLITWDTHDFARKYCTEVLL